MDPLSISMAAFSAAKTLYKASSTIYQFIQDAKVVDRVLEGLRLEFDSTASILELIKTRLRNPVHLIHARSQDHQGFLDIALASIQECDDASSEVTTKIEEISGGSSSMYSRSVRRIRYMRIQKDILRTHTRIRDQKQNLQLLIQMLDVLLTHQSAALLTEKVLPPLSSLQLLIESASKSKTEVYIRPTDSSKSLALVTTRDITKEGSAPDTPVRSMNDFPDYSEEEQESHNLNAQMIQEFQDRGACLLESKSYADAEKAFSNCLKMHEILPIDSLPSDSIVQAQLGLATALMHQEKWAQAGELFIYLAEHEIDNAYTACLEAHAEFELVAERLRCTKLLVLIAQTNGDEPSAAIYANGLREDETSLWAALPFYRFTHQGHGLSVSEERTALEYVEKLKCSPCSALVFSSYEGELNAVKLLLWQGAAIDETSGEFSEQHGTRLVTALMASAYRGHTKVVEFLIQLGADLYVECEAYRNLFGGRLTDISAFDFALRSRNMSAVRIILDAMTPRGIKYLNGLQTAVLDNNDIAVNFLLAYKDFHKTIKKDCSQDETARILELAIDHQNLNIVKKLIAAEFIMPTETHVASAKKRGNSDIYQEVARAYARRQGF